MSDIQGFRGGKIAEGRAMWESPITQVSTQLEQKMHEEEDKLVIEVSQMIGYDINKEELIKALHYSQEQFAKGYDKGHERGYTTGYAKAISDFAEKMNKAIAEQSGNDGGFSKAFYTGMVEGVKILLEESQKEPKTDTDIGCVTCPNVKHCDSAYSENAHLCNLYNHKPYNSCNDCEYNCEYGGCDCGHLCIYGSEFVPKKKGEKKE